MKVEFRLAWRNLQRNRRRTALTSSALCIGLTMLIFMFSLLDGVDRQSIDNLVKFDVAHVKAFAPGYLDDEVPGLENVLTNVDSLLEVITASGEAKAAAARLEMSGVLIFSGEETFARVVGVDPKTDVSVFETLGAVVDGRTLSDNTPLALVGDRLSSELNIHTGDIITVLIRSSPGAFNTRSIPVSGIISTGHPKIDQFTVIIPLKTAQELALLPDGATEIAVTTKKFSKSAQSVLQLAGVIPAIDWRNWRFLARDFLGLARFKRIGNGIFMAIFVLMATVGVANTMVIAIHERTREIGTLRALGFSQRRISRIFLAEGFQLGVLAGIAALALGSACVYYLSIHGWSLEAYGDMDMGYPVRDAIYPYLSVWTLVGSFVFGVLLSVMASWGSARRAARGEVVKALREGML